jgi:SAM-dependent methyltransferase
MRDTFGQQLYAQYKNRKLTTETVERNDGFKEESDYASRYFTDYPKWNAKEKQAIKFAKGRTLDIGLGAGRHALYLQRKGFDVVGIDNSPLAIKVSKLRGVKNAKVLAIEKVDKLKGDSFDTILLMGNNFGLMGSFKKAKTILKKLYKITTKKGQIVAECLDPYGTDNPIHLKYHSANRKRGRMSGQLRLRVNYKNTKGDWFDYLFVSVKEMKDILKGTGWKVNKVIGKEGGIYIAILGKGEK